MYKYKYSISNFGRRRVDFALRFAVAKTTSLLRTHLAQTTTASNSRNFDLTLQHIRIHANDRKPRSAATFLKQSRWFSTAARDCFRSRPHAGLRCDRTSFPGSKIGRAIHLHSAAPFASTLRPNLTGGALPRSAGGYSLGGTGFAGRTVRHFSHTPSAQAQVLHNVSAGIRAFVVNGGKVRFDGLDAKTGEKRFKSISATEDEILRKLEKPLEAFAKGTNLEFQLSPTITALSTTLFPQSVSNELTLASPDILFNLSADFAHALKDFSAVLSDLRSLSTLGALPITLSTTPFGPVLKCRFPGCDAESVTNLCDEVGIERGIVREDEAWQRDRDSEMALLFPFAPGVGIQAPSDDEAMSFSGQLAAAPSEELNWHQIMSPPSSVTSILSAASNDEVYDTLTEHRSPVDPERRDNNHIHSAISGYGGLCGSDFASNDTYSPGQHGFLPRESSLDGSTAFEGLEGIYRFLRECEDARN